jgi:hypothetical protein
MWIFFLGEIVQKVHLTMLLKNFKKKEKENWQILATKKSVWYNILCGASDKNSIRFLLLARIWCLNSL